jgi:hypothetical protein
MTAALHRVLVCAGTLAFVAAVALVERMGGSGTKRRT